MEDSGTSEEEDTDSQDSNIPTQASAANIHKTTTPEDVSHSQG